MNQNEFHKYGLIDQPKQRAANTNDRNIARWVISNPTRTSEITGVDINLTSSILMITDVLLCNKKLMQQNLRI